MTIEAVAAEFLTSLKGKLGDELIILPGATDEESLKIREFFNGLLIVPPADLIRLYKITRGVWHPDFETGFLNDPLGSFPEYESPAYEFGATLDLAVEELEEFGMVELGRGENSGMCCSEDSDFIIGPLYSASVPGKRAASFIDCFTAYVRDLKTELGHM